MLVEVNGLDVVLVVMGVVQLVVGLVLGVELVVVVVNGLVMDMLVPFAVLRLMMAGLTFVHLVGVFVLVRSDFLLESTQNLVLVMSSVAVFVVTVFAIKVQLFLVVSGFMMVVGVARSLVLVVTPLDVQDLLGVRFVMDRVLMPVVMLVLPDVEMFVTLLSVLVLLLTVPVVGGFLVVRVGIR